MKKTLVAIAALAATSAFAQSSVTAYGVVDAAYYTAKVETGLKKTTYAGLTNSNLAGSRLGFKGTEDLGNGLKANFVAEMALNAIGDGFGNKQDGAGAPAANKTSDAAVGAVFNRQTWVGLDSAKMGEVRVGYMNTLQYDHNGPFSAGFEGAAGAREHLEVLSGASLPKVDANLETNRVTGVTYFAPVMGGVKLAAQWGALKATQEQGGTATGGTNYTASHASLSANYSNGPLAIGGVVAQSIAQTNAADKATYQGDRTETNAYSLGASYDLKVAKLFAYYGDRKTSNGAGANEVNVTVYRFGAQVPVGNFKLFATMGQLNGDQGTTEVSNRKTTQVGTLYSFSKRTTGFALYGKDKADLALGGFTTAGAGITAAAAATTTSTLRIGVSHSF